MTELRIDIPYYIDDNEEIKEWICSNADLFKSAMDLDVSIYDDRAIITDPIRITYIELCDEEVRIFYEFDYEANYTCQDFDRSDTIEGRIVGQRENNCLLFKKFKSLEKRSTSDEF